MKDDAKRIVLSRRARFVAAALAAAGAAFAADRPASEFRPPWHAQAPSTQSSQEQRVESVARHKRAEHLFSEGNYEAARVEFIRAYQLAPSRGALERIAATCERLDDWATAYWAWKELEETATEEADRDRSHEQRLKARERCATIRVSAPADAEVKIDDEVRPREGDLLIVNPGIRKISITDEAQRERGVEMVTLRAGDELTYAPEMRPMVCLSPPPPPRGCSCEVPGCPRH